MPFTDQLDAFDYLLALERKLEMRNLNHAAKHLNFYLTGAGAATTGEHVELMQEGLEEFLKQFGHLVSTEDNAKVADALAAYAAAYSRRR